MDKGISKYMQADIRFGLVLAATVAKPCRSCWNSACSQMSLSRFVICHRKPAMTHATKSQLAWARKPEQGTAICNFRQYRTINSAQGTPPYPAFACKPVHSSKLGRRELRQPCSDTLHVDNTCCKDHVASMPEASHAAG